MVRSFFRLGLGMGFSNLEFLGQIAALERRLRRAALTPLALPYPFCTSTRAQMGAERDKQEVRKKMYLGGIRPSYYWIIAYIYIYAELERINQRDNISKLASKFFPTTLFLWPPRSACPIVAATAVCRYLSAL